MTDVLASHLRELITDQRHFLARAEKILDYLEKNNIPTDTSARTDPKPDYLIAEEHHELEQAVKEAALYHLNSVNKKSPPPEQLESKAKNSSKPSSRVKSTKNEKNLDTDNSNSSQLTSRSNAASDFGLPVSHLNINIIVVAPQKKAIKKRGKAKNQRKQGTDDSTTSNSNTHAEEVSGESNMDITSASLPRFNQFPRFQSGSEGSGPNSIPMWFRHLYSLINQSNSSPLNFQSITHTGYSQRNWQRIYGHGYNNHNSSEQNDYINSGNAFIATMVIEAEMNSELSDLD